jgi:uncharacterized phage-associated protein
MIGFNYRKAVQTLNFFAQKEGSVINKMKVFKLIWLSDRLHLRKYGRPILNDVYFALPKGPIPSTTKDLADNSDFLADTEKELREQFIENVSRFTIKAKAETQKSVFSQSDLEVMNLVYDHFGSLNEFQLSDLSHQYPEWKKFENGLNIGHSSRFEMSYQDFFETNQEQNHQIFEQDEEILELNKEVFLENQMIGNLI